MQHQVLCSQSFNRYVYSFGQWLQTLGYSPGTIRNYPSMLREFLHYCESKKVMQAVLIRSSLIESYMEYLQTRKKVRTEGALSATYINSHVRMLQLFRDWLSGTQAVDLALNIQRVLEEKKTDYIILNIEEVKKLYEVTDESAHGMRDRAMLAIHYGCGLRKSEGIYLDVNDILFERKLIYVRRSKNNHERYVPVTKTNLEWLEQWICNGRILLLPEHSKETALFISERGHRISDYMIYLRLKALQKKAGIPKEIGLHTLRHSIATHLLQKGMELENIALFLGHRCLDSTQIYTHIVNETL